MKYTVNNIIDEANSVAEQQGKEFSYTVNQNQLLLMDDDVKELINYLSNNDTNYSTYSHA